MLYYKIPLDEDGFDYPAGSVLCCAYPYSGHMYCKFELLTEIGAGWIQITESEFNIRCPEFPAPSHFGELESADYPGCYYRMADGEQEWRNPPMVFGQSYRTTERFNGKPVYVGSVNIPKLVEDREDPVDYKDALVYGAEVFHVSGTISSGGLVYIQIPYYYSDTQYCHVDVRWPENNEVVVAHGEDLVGHQCQLLFKFVKPEADE